MNLRFYRCKQCLSTFTTDMDSGEVRTAGLFCECGGGTEYLGTAGPKTYHGRHHVVEVGSKCACDERCTNATGPNCDCICNGKNHGTKRVVPCILREGRYYAQQVDQKAFDRASEYLSWVDAAKEFIKSNNNTVGAFRVSRALRDASEYRVHKKRIETIKKAYEHAVLALSA